MKYVLALTAVMALSACSTKAPEDPSKKSPPKTPKIIGSATKASGISFDARQLANEMESNYVSEIRFKKGSTELNSDARRSLAQVLERAGKEGSDKVVKLITWADSEMPDEKKGELSDDQRELAKRRNDVLTKFIQDKKRDINIDPISMAERPSGLKRIVPNEAARIQESLDEAGIPEKGDKKEGLGKASRSIIIFTRE
ncbi:MAG: hypothetical protein V4598_09305 [Bdellovibrionota bacterium]